MLDPQLHPLYHKYNSVLKPLVAEYESRNENFVTLLLVDLPDMFDYVALYSTSNDEKDIHKAMDCLNSAIDSMRVSLVGSLMENIETFKRKVPKRIRITLDEGRFYGDFAKLENEVRYYKNKDLDKTYSLLKKMEGMINEVHSSSLTNALLLDKKEVVVWKWILTIVIALLVNYLILILL